MLRVEGKETVADSSVRLQLEEGINFFKLDLKRCQRQIEQSHPEFKNIKVNRVLPDKVIVFFENSSFVKAPRPGPISRIKSSFWNLEEFIIFFMMFLSIRKFWERLFLGKVFVFLKNF